jgi:hypothetical protein
MGSILQNLRYGFKDSDGRRVRGNGACDASAGFGAITAIFTLTYQVLLRSIAVEHPGQL